MDPLSTAIMIEEQANLMYNGHITLIIEKSIVPLSTYLSVNYNPESRDAGVKRYPSTTFFHPKNHVKVLCKDKLIWDDNAPLQQVRKNSALSLMQRCGAMFNAIMGEHYDDKKPPALCFSEKLLTQYKIEKVYCESAIDITQKTNDIRTNVSQNQTLIQLVYLRGNLEYLIYLKKIHEMRADYSGPRCQNECPYCVSSQTNILISIINKYSESYKYSQRSDCVRDSSVNGESHIKSAILSYLKIRKDLSFSDEEERYEEPQAGQKGLLDYLIFPLVARSAVPDELPCCRRDLVPEHQLLLSVLETIRFVLEVLRLILGAALTCLCILTVVPVLHCHLQFWPLSHQVKIPSLSDEDTKDLIQPRDSL